MNEFLNPEKILNELDLREEMNAADFGCGSGGWVAPLAKKLEKGTVYAIDVMEEPLSALRNKIEMHKLTNINIFRSDVETKNGSKLISESLDLVLLTNLLFQVEDKKIVLEEAKRVLKPGGQILVAEWLANSAFGPQQERVSMEEVKKIAAEIGLKIKKEFGAGNYHYGLVLIK